eukprot:14017236-Alexandrium_andersonii.AAC.1
MASSLRGAETKLALRTSLLPAPWRLDATPPGSALLYELRRLSQSVVWRLFWNGGCRTTSIVVRTLAERQAGTDSDSALDSHLWRR